MALLLILLFVLKASTLNSISPLLKRDCIVLFASSVLDIFLVNIIFAIRWTSVPMSALLSLKFFLSKNDFSTTIFDSSSFKSGFLILT
jgi:hypothetical protein